MKKLAVIITLLTTMHFSSSDEVEEMPEPTTNYIVEVSVKPPFTMEFYDRQRGVESDDNQDAVSPKGATGIAQFMPRTWEYIKEINLIPRYFDIHNAAHQKTAQIAYMSYLYYLLRKNHANAKELTVASYNAGIGRVTELVALHNTKWRENLPLETKDYLIKLKQ